MDVCVPGVKESDKTPETQLPPAAAAAAAAAADGDGGDDAAAAAAAAASSRAAAAAAAASRVAAVADVEDATRSKAGERRNVAMFLSHSWSHSGVDKTDTLKLVVNFNTAAVTLFVLNPLLVGLCYAIRGEEAGSLTPSFIRLNFKRLK